MAKKKKKSSSGWLSKKLGRLSRRTVFVAGFALIGAVLVFKSFAATKSVTYDITLNNGNPSRSFDVTVGSGTLEASHDSTDSNTRLSLLNDAGDILVQKTGAGSSISSEVAPGSFTVKVDYTKNKIKGANKFNLNISYPVVDTSNPTVVITSPTSSEVSGTVNFSANASDDTGIDKVELIVDGIVVSSLSSSPYTYSWDSTAVSDGNYQLMAKAYDDAGNTAEASMTVTVTNSSSTPPPEPEPDPDPTDYPEAMWHADPDTDSFLSGETTYWRRLETENGNPNRFTIVNDPKGLYGKVYRAQTTSQELSAGDKRAEYAQATLRPEDTKLRLAVDSTPRGSTQNIYFGWRSLLGSDVKVDGGKNNGNYMQLKGDSSCGGPAIGMTIKYGRLTLRSEQFLTEYNNIAWNGPEMSTLYNKWHDFVLHVNFSKDASVGYLEVWFNGTKQTMMNGQTRIYFPTVCPNDTYVFPKLGVYSFDSPAPGEGPIHWFESPRIGSSFDSAVPR